MNKISLAFALVFFIALSFTGCKSTKKVGTVEAGGAKAHNEFFALMQEQAFKYETLTARLNVDLNLPGNNMSSRVDLKMVKDSAFQLSVQPFLGIEVFRAEISVDSVKVIDRMNKRYVADNYANLKGQTPIEFNFYNLQALFTNRLCSPVFNRCAYLYFLQSYGEGEVVGAGTFQRTVGQGHSGGGGGDGVPFCETCIHSQDVIVYLHPHVRRRCDARRSGGIMGWNQEEVLVGVKQGNFGACLRQLDALGGIFRADVSL